jgi:heptosyltransferase II
VNILIVKLGATGDVVRTTPLLRRLGPPVTWLTAAKNMVLVQGIRENLRCFSWEQRELCRDRKYDLVINLEDTEEAARFVGTVERGQLFGVYLDAGGVLRYTDDSKAWFDLSLISVHGRQKADRLKFLNQRTYQDLVFGGLGFSFQGEEYLLPGPTPTDLAGDVAIAPEAGPVWPMKNWAFYPDLKRALEARGLKVNVLPVRPSLLEHLGDVANHRCLVSGDSLPMHLALGTRTRCSTLFTCTSPHEIHDYGLQEKIVSPLLDEFFFKRGHDTRATTAIRVDEVLKAVVRQLDPPA